MVMPLVAVGPDHDLTGADANTACDQRPHRTIRLLEVAVLLAHGELPPSVLRLYRPVTRSHMETVSREIIAANKRPSWTLVAAAWQLLDINAELGDLLTWVRSERPTPPQFVDVVHAIRSLVVR